MAKLRLKEKRAAEEEGLKRQLEHLQRDLDCVGAALNYATDEALIDGYIYEQRSLHMKYQYFLRLCKERGMKAAR